MNSAAHNTAKAELLANRPLLKTLADEAIKFFAKKHDVSETEIRAAYGAGAPAVRSQVMQLVLEGYIMARGLA
jgi:hypothetical protein